MPSDKEVAMTGADSRPLKNASQERAFPLSMPQLGLWAAQHMQPGSSACVTAQYSQILGAIDVPVFERASRLVIGETEALRLCFGEAAGPLQWVQPPRAWSLPLIDLSDQPEPESAAVAWMKNQLAQPIDPRRGYAFRWTLLRLDARHFVWSFQVHHLIMDGFSRNLVWRRLEQAYAALAAQQPLPPAEFAPLRDRFAHEQKYYRSASFDEDRRFFAALLKERPPQVTLSRKPPAATRKFHRSTTYLPGPTTATLRAAVAGASVARTFVAALFQRSELGGDDIVIGLVVSARVGPADRRTPSMLSNVVPLRLRLHDAMSVDDLLIQAAGAIRELMKHQRYPSQALRRDLQLLPMAPDVYSVTVNFMPFDPGTTFAGYLASTHNLSNGPVADLVIGVFDPPGAVALRIDLNGNTELYDDEALASHARRLTSIMTQIAAGTGDRSIGTLLAGMRCGDVAGRSQLASQERRPVAADQMQLARWNATSADYPRDRPLNWLLRAQAARTPTAVALEAGELQLTYAELFVRADVLAARLRQAGATRESRVGMFLGRSAALPQAMLAILEAGAAYVPLDPAFPRDRLAFMIEDAQLRIIISRRSLVAELPPHAAQVICVDDELPVPPSDGVGTTADAGSVAYVLYTSGSTGKPKGVEVEHRQLVNLLCSMARTLRVDPSDRLLAVTSISFDIAGLEIWLPLLCGARLCIASREEIVDADLLRQALARSRATILQATPVTWRALLASGWCGGGHFKALVGGEALPADLAQMLVSKCGEAWNLYGPTETTIWSSAWRLPDPVERVRVGKPIANTELHVLDEQLRPLPIGVAGELFIGGDGVARGYLNRPELTAIRFVADPFRGGTARLYRTGDLARWLPDGTVELFGRNDDQIKIRGHRIEAGEVEAALLRLCAVAQAAVAVHRPDSGEARLIAGLVPAQGATLPSSAALRAELRQWLPEYMLPSHFLQLTALPLTPNGKVDRRSLARLSTASQQEVPEANTPAAPASALEALLLDHFSRSLGGKITLDSDFFERGGDSLEALRLVSHLSQELGIEVTSGELFLHLTPRSMAARLELLLAGAAAPRHLLPLGGGESRAAVVFIHPRGGHLTSYGRLVHHLGESITLFGLQGGTGQQRYDSLAQRCTAYVREVEAATTGPLVLFGYSLGGALAIEMAQQLRQAGRAIPLVLLVDAAVPGEMPQGWSKLKLRLQELWRFSWHDRRTWLKDQLGRWLGAMPSPAFGEAAGLVDTAEMQRLIVQAQQWQAPNYEGKVHLFRAARNLRGYPNPTGALGWDKYCSDLDVVSLPCNHAEILVEPQVLRIVEDLKSLLKATLQRQGTADRTNVSPDESVQPLEQFLAQ